MAGLVVMGAINSSRYTLLAATSPDVDLVAVVSTDKLPTGGGHFVGPVARLLDGNNMYMARLDIAHTGVTNLTLRKRVGGTETALGSTINLGIAPAANKQYGVRLQIAGSTLRARAWLASVTEPTAWQTTVTDTSLTAAGSIGTRSILSTNNTNTLPVTAAWHRLADEDGPQRMTVVRSVNRIVKPHSAGVAVALADPSYVAL